PSVSSRLRARWLSRPSSAPPQLDGYLLDTKAYTSDIIASMAPDALLRLKRRYQHFCPAARALETIGEKWSLLIVRDLLGGPRRTTWVFRFGEARSYTIRFGGARWTRQRGEAAADVIVQTSPDEWVKFLSADVEGRRRWLRKRRAKGTRQRLDELATAFGAA